jgi:ribokinase
MASSLPIVTIIGSLNADLIIRTTRIPEGGETLTARSFDTGAGGKGANQAVACARLSRARKDVTAFQQSVRASSNSGPTASSSPEVGHVQVKMVGAVGDDEFGNMLVETLRAETIDVSRVVKTSEAQTGVAVIIVEEETGQNRIMLSPGANYTLEPQAFRTLEAPLPALIMLQLEIPLEAVMRILATANTKHVPVLLNAAPATALPDEAYGMITHLIVNEIEAAALSERLGHKVASIEDCHSVASSLLQKGTRNVIITLGENGVYYASSEGNCPEGSLSAVKAAVVDTTAAGDTFVGAYAIEAALTKGGQLFDIQKAVESGNRAAARTVEREGAQRSIPYLDDMERKHVDALTVRYARSAEP